MSNLSNASSVDIILDLSMSRSSHHNKKSVSQAMQKSSMTGLYRHEDHLLLF